MDDTIFDFKGEFYRRCNECEFPQSKYGFFLNLKPIPDAIESVTELMKDHDVWFATRPSFYNVLSYTEKRVCIENNFGFDAVSKLILIPDKSLLKGDILIDDSVRDGQLYFDGTLLRFGKDGVSSDETMVDITWVNKQKSIVYTKTWKDVMKHLGYGG